MSDALTISALSYRYHVPSAHEFHLRGVRLTFPAGNICGLIGPSGSGKTTVLKLISGELRAQSGSIRLGDQELSSVPFGSRHTATVHQSSSLIPFLTSMENVSVASWAKGLPRRAANARAVEWLARLGIEHLAHQQVDRLSGGQRQSVAIARALASEPAILLMDEPTASLDMLSVDNLVALIGDIRAVRPSMVTLIVTHDRDFCLRIADYLSVIDDGSILWSGKSADALSGPDSRRALELVGAAIVISCTAEGSSVRVPAEQGKGTDVTLCRLDSELLPGRYVMVIARDEARLVPLSTASGMDLPGTVERLRLGVNGEIRADIGLQTGLTIRSVSARGLNLELHRVGAPVALELPADRVRFLKLN